MTEEIKEILDRLKRIDYKEYSCGFEFADSATFNEMARCFEERKKMNDCITNLQQENEKEKQFIKDCGFQNQQQLVLAYLDYKSRCEKATRKIDSMFANGDEDKVIDGLSELDKILRGKNDD